MKKIRSIMIAMLLVLSLMLGTISPILWAAAESKPITYVSFGDSMTNGYGLGTKEEPFVHEGYLNAISTTYPVLIRNYLQEKNPDKEVVLKQMAINGMRIDDLLYLLEAGMDGGYAGDDYTDGLFYYEDEEMINEYQTAVKTADYITIYLGNNNFLRMLEQIFGILDSLSNDTVGNLWGGTVHDYDLSELLFEGHENLKDSFDKTYEFLRNSFLSLLKALHVDSDVRDVYIPIAERISSDMMYCLIGFLKHYKSVLDRIYKMNDNATIILMGMSNVMRDIQLTFKVNGFTTSIDMGDIMGVLTNLSNNYIASLTTRYNAKKILSFKKINKLYYTEVDALNIITANFAQGIGQDMRAALIGDFTYDIVKLIESSLSSELDSLKTIGIESLKHKLKSDAALNSYSNYMNYTENGGDADQEEMLTMAIYRAIEYAIVEACRTNILPVETFSAFVNGMDNIFATEKIKSLFTAQNIQNAIDSHDYETHFVKPLQEELSSNKELSGLLLVFGKFLSSNGMGIHPSEIGHQQYADAVIKAIDAKEYGSAYLFKKAIKAPLKFVSKVFSSMEVFFKFVTFSLKKVVHWTVL